MTAAEESKSDEQCEQPVLTCTTPSPFGVDFHLPLSSRMSSSADKLVVKCTFDKWHKRIVFNSARNCSYDLLKKKVEECFSLYGALYTISYKDDDGEISNIATDGDLVEAIQYFQAGDDAPMSSAASILSGRSFGPRKITLRVNIMVDYDGPSLSDTSSLASIEEFKGRNGSQLSFSYGTPNVEVDDDSVTVSSRDPGTSSTSSRNGKSSFGSSLKSLAKQRSFVNSDHRSKTSAGLLTSDRTQREAPGVDHTAQGGPPSTSDGRLVASAAERFPENPSAIFERLKLSESLQDDSSSINNDSLAANERGAAWLRDQNERTIRSMLGALPEPSISDDRSFSLDSQSDSLGGDLALERDTRGRYYYTYMSGSASQSHGSVADEEAQSGNGDADIYPTPNNRGPRPTSMQLNWLASQQIKQPGIQRFESDLQSLSIQEEPVEDPNFSFERDVLPYVEVEPPPLEILTDCSNCGRILDSVRYVCSTCGQKEPVHALAYNDKGKDKDVSPVGSFTYPPQGHSLFSSPNSSSSQTYVASTETSATRLKPSPSLPSTHSLSSLNSLFGGSRMRLKTPPSPSQPYHTQGYELCSECLESFGIDHAVDGALGGPGSSAIVNDVSHNSEEEKSRRRRLAPRKGQPRHAYQEMSWTHYGWQDVALDEELVSTCSTCSTQTHDDRYKCVSCLNIHLCKACYSQVHELHPSHAFLNIPDKMPDRPIATPNPHEESSLTHQGVKCAHCLLDIVGARFHCAVCDSLDICSNCESAGLPGNLDSADGGHLSSHIMIKIPFPLDSSELQLASRRAQDLWMGRDAANVGFTITRSKAASEISYAHTMIGPRSTRDGRSLEHRVACNNCKNTIIGVRYQCIHCPTQPFPYAYNLCANCEARSYAIHDATHIFCKFIKKVDRPLETQNSLLPILYKTPVGPASNAPRTSDPKAYLSSLTHSSAVCDRCMTRIQGEWFRCGYCNIDLCDVCESVDTHNDLHAFLVFKAPIDMQLFKNLANVENPANGPPILPYPVYL